MAIAVPLKISLFRGLTVNAVRNRHAWTDVLRGLTAMVRNRRQDASLPVSTAIASHRTFPEPSSDKACVFHTGDRVHGQ